MAQFRNDKTDNLSANLAANSNDKASNARNIVSVVNKRKPRSARWKR